MSRLPFAVLAVLLLAGCGGSGDGLVPVAQPAHSPPLDARPAGRVVHAPGRVARTRLRVAVTADDGRVAVLRPRARTLELLDRRTRRSLGRIPVGIGPTQVIARGERLFVVDTRGNALIEVLPDPLRVHRRTHLPGAPYGIAYDAVRKRFWVTLTASNEVAELTDRRLLRTFPSVRQPDAVAVDAATGRVLVASGLEGRLQLLDPPPYDG